jgi:hypothetical protein
VPSSKDTVPPSSPWPASGRPSRRARGAPSEVAVRAAIGDDHKQLVIDGARRPGRPSAIGPGEQGAFRQATEALVAILKGAATPAGMAWLVGRHAPHVHELVAAKKGACQASREDRHHGPANAASETHAGGHAFILTRGLRLDRSSTRASRCCASRRGSRRSGCHGCPAVAHRLRRALLLEALEARPRLDEPWLPTG